MSLKPKTVRRLTLLGLVAALLVGGGFSLIVVRKGAGGRAPGPPRAVLPARTVADAPVMRAEAAALFATRSSPDRVKQLLDRLSTLQPLNIGNESVRLQWLAQTASPADARAYA